MDKALGILRALPTKKEGEIKGRKQKNAQDDNNEDNLGCA